MPGVDFAAVQSRASMSKVLEFIGFVASTASGDQLHGPCPVHKSQSSRSRTFSVNTAQSLCHCHKCGFSGNQIQLWAIVNEMSVYDAAIDLCHKTGVDVPWIKRW